MEPNWPLIIIVIIAAIALIIFIIWRNQKDRKDLVRKLIDEDEISILKEHKSEDDSTD